MQNAPLSLLGTQTGTTMNYRTVFLQRLANPLVAYHPLTNPYLTVDWMPVDLTVFNGEDRKPSGPTSWDDSKGPWDPDDVSKKNGFENYNDQDMTVAFSSRQRGQFSTAGKPAPDGNTKYNLWSQWPGQVPSTDPLFDLGGEDPVKNLQREDRNLTTVNFRFNLNDTTVVANAGTTPGVGNASLGFLNHSYGPPSVLAQVNGNTAYVGDPQKPFPWITWNNRPYANVTELMLVPATHPGRLLMEFDAGNPNKVMAYSGTLGQIQLFPHLLNFFSSSTSSTGAPNLSQMFEYLQVPSPFVGTEQALNPSKFAGDWWFATAGKPGEVSGGTEPPGTAGLHPPFNFVSNYRDPGKVNVNTIVGEFDSSGTLKGSVWNAIVGGDPATSPTIGATFHDVALSRQGYTPTGASTDTATFYKFDPAHPSIFSNPFRSASGADMVPLNPIAPTAATIFRADTTQHPLLAGTLPTADYNNASRNPYFYYESLNHLTNKLTTRSNVYAVWVTVGYFEVTPWYGINTATGLPNTTGVQVFDNPHPDGYQLGQEVGADSGQIQRHRAFYIIDRSIPVGFQRGYDNNDSNAVILKRFIE